MEKKDTIWPVGYVDRAVAHILTESNTNFESLIANLENNPDLYTLVENILMNDAEMSYNEDSNLIKLEILYGIYKKANILKIHNHIPIAASRNQTII